MTLHDDLHAAITARQERARAATPGPWSLGGEGLRADGHPNGELFAVGVDQDELSRWVAMTWDGPDAVHIAAEDPAVVLRHCERDLADLAEHEGCHACDEDGACDWLKRAGVAYGLEAP